VNVERMIFGMLYYKILSNMFLYLNVTGMINGVLGYDGSGVEMFSGIWGI